MGTLVLKLMTDRLFGGRQCRIGDIALVCAATYTPEGRRMGYLVHPVVCIEITSEDVPAFRSLLYPSDAPFFDTRFAWSCWPAISREPATWAWMPDADGRRSAASTGLRYADPNAPTGPRHPG